MIGLSCKILNPSNPKIIFDVLYKILYNVFVAISPEINVFGFQKKANR